MKRASVLILIIGVGLTITDPSRAESDENEDADTETLAEIDRKLNNPLTDLWSLTFQENYSLLRGHEIDDTYSNSFFFQPALPIPIGDNKDKTFIVRPVFPIVTVPQFDPLQPGRVDKHITGLGDIQAFAIVGPNRSDGNVIGYGATFKFPTASSDVLGASKWQAGPAFLWFSMRRPWTKGIVLQPTIVYDWEADEGNRLTLPISLGITKTVRIGQTPVKIRVEPQYSIISPDDFGTKWNFRVQIAPVIKSPFTK